VMLVVLVLACGQVQRLVPVVVVLRAGRWTDWPPVEAHVQLFGRNGLADEEGFGHSECRPVLACGREENE
jgi:hypothetical protein